MHEHLHEVYLGAVLANPSKHILILCHRGGRWWFPGGLLKAGENWEESLKRSVKEETGISDIEIYEPIKQISFPAGEMGNSPTFGNFLFCHTEQMDVTPASHYSFHKWLSPYEEWKELKKFHPVMNFMINEAFDAGIRQDPLKILRNAEKILSADELQGFMDLDDAVDFDSGDAMDMIQKMINDPKARKGIKGMFGSDIMNDLFKDSMDTSYSQEEGEGEEGKQ